MTSVIMFLGFVVLAKGIEVDPEKVKTILKWLVASKLQELRSFHELSTFY